MACLSLSHGPVVCGPPCAVGDRALACLHILCTGRERRLGLRAVAAATSTLTDAGRGGNERGRGRGWGWGWGWLWGTLWG